MMAVKAEQAEIIGLGPSGTRGATARPQDSPRCQLLTARYKVY